MGYVIVGTKTSRLFVVSGKAVVSEMTDNKVTMKLRKNDFKLFLSCTIKKSSVNMKSCRVRENVVDIRRKSEDVNVYVEGHNTILTYTFEGPALPITIKGLAPDQVDHLRLYDSEFEV